MNRSELAQRQAALVAALVCDGPVPAGFDPYLIRATATALLRKRAGEVATRWPSLRSQLGPQWMRQFTEWAEGKPPRGALRDGWDFAHTLDLGPVAALELATYAVVFHYDGVRPPSRRRLPAVRRVPGAVVMQAIGRVRVLRTDRVRWNRRR